MRKLTPDTATCFGVHARFKHERGAAECRVACLLVAATIAARPIRAREAANLNMRHCVRCEMQVLFNAQHWIKLDERLRTTLTATLNTTARHRFAPTRPSPPPMTGRAARTALRHDGGVCARAVDIGCCVVRLLAYRERYLRAGFVDPPCRSQRDETDPHWNHACARMRAHAAIRSAPFPRRRQVLSHPPARSLQSRFNMLLDATNPAICKVRPIALGSKIKAERRCGTGKVSARWRRF